MPFSVCIPATSVGGQLFTRAYHHMAPSGVNGVHTLGGDSVLHFEERATRGFTTGYCLPPPPQFGDIGKDEIKSRYIEPLPPVAIDTPAPKKEPPPTGAVLKRDVRSAHNTFHTS